MVLLAAHLILVPATHQDSVHDGAQAFESPSLILVLAAQEFAQRAMVAYVRSEFLQPNKAVHDVTALPAVDLAQSWGLLTAPRLRFLKKVSCWW